MPEEIRNKKHPVMLTEAEIEYLILRINNPGDALFGPRDLLLVFQQALKNIEREKHELAPVGSQSNPISHHPTKCEDAHPTMSHLKWLGRTAALVEGFNESRKDAR